MTALARSTPIELHDIHADVWHAHALSQRAWPVLATGDAALDAQLPGGGWPVGALTEILQPPGVHGEWRLLSPALAHSAAGPVVLVAAPHLPFAPALAALGLAAQRLLWVKAQAAAERLWACEQALRCAEVVAVLAWLPQARSEQLRRLQMTAAQYNKLLFVMRPESAQHEASPAALRLHLQPQAALPTPTPTPTSTSTSTPTPMPMAYARLSATPTLPARSGTDSLQTDSLQMDGLQVHLLKRRGPPLARPLQLQAPIGLALLLASSQAHALDCRTSRA